MMLALLVSSLLQTSTWTDRAVLRAERVVVGKVERIFEAREGRGAATPARVALVAVSEVFMGPENPGPLLVIDRAALPGMERLEVGVEAMLVLVRPRDPDGKQRAMLEPQLQGAPSCELLARVEDLQRVEGCPWLLPPGLRDDLVAERSSLQPESVRARLRASIERVLPCLEASYTSTSMRNWSLLLDARGRYVVCGEEQPALDKGALATFWKVLEPLHPETLPERIPTDWPPCASVYTLELRTRGGFRRLRANYGELSPKATAEERDAYRRFAALWELLPGAGKPDGLP